MNRLSFVALSLVFFSSAAFAVDPQPGFPETLTNTQIRECVEKIDDETISYNSSCFVTIDGLTYSKEFDAQGDFSHLYLMDPPLTLSGAFVETAGDTSTYAISAPDTSKTARMILRKSVAP